MAKTLLQVYQEFTASTNIVDDPDISEQHILMGLAAEAGEVCGVRQKFIRDELTDSRWGTGDPEYEQYVDKLMYEMGDVLWHLSELANYHCFSLEDVLELNMKKLQDRKNRGVITGSGDAR